MKAKAVTYCNFKDNFYKKIQASLLTSVSRQYLEIGDTTHRGCLQACENSQNSTLVNVPLNITGSDLYITHSYRTKDE